ncbi:MAG TPA: putative lipid II flippase FtsW [Candidatus Binataceae bacterium]|jgi:cell division protein FtsW|nr:putative lipid II flippase FtsW [Candidatus Binataceae bacterium]
MPSAARQNPIILTTPRRAAVDPGQWFESFDLAAALRADPWLWGSAAALVVLGLMMVLNTTYFLGLEKTGNPFYFFERQLMNLALGLTVMTLASQFSLRGLRAIAMPLALVAVVMFLAVWVPGLGIVRGGARRWLRLGPILVEPSETLKLAAVFLLARYMSQYQDKLEIPKFLIPVFAAIGILALILLKQPDFGAAVMLTLLLFTMLFAAGAGFKHLGAAGAVALFALAVQAGRKAYRMRRLSAFLNPWETARGSGFQLIQSFIAFGAGGGWGVGLGASRQKMFYLPQAHNDFVFAVIGEEFGVAGAMVVIALFITILIRGMRVARNESDPFGSLLAVGLTALLSLQAFVNMAVVTGLVPTKGLPLPFLSYGGTSMVVSLAAVGFLMALARRSGMR